MWNRAHALVYKAHMPDAPNAPNAPDQPDPNGAAVQSPPQASIRARLARRFDPAELREIKRLWIRHSIAEDARDIDGLIATLTPDAVYDMVPTGQRWHGLDGVRQFYMELFTAFPDNRFALSEIVVGPQGVFEVARLTGTNLGPWAGVPASGLPIDLEVLILFPWDPAEARFRGERIWFAR
jgi:predicted ester cyclase